MADHKHIDELLADWAYDPESVNVRISQGADGRDVLQMRVDMGLLQLETTARPDGWKPQGNPTYLQYLKKLRRKKGGDLVLSDDQCGEVDREFVQFYHRRICWLKLGRYAQAVKDADHTLGLMDMCREVSPDEQWTLTHEQYRPFVLFHRIQAAALTALEGQDEETGAQTAIEEINRGLVQLHDLFAEYDAEEHFEDDDLVRRLRDMREAMRNRYNVGRTLQEQLKDAVESEQYELAAQLRDELAKRGNAI